MDEEKPGATGKFPHGIINDDDEGEIKIGIGVSDTGEVVLQFGKLISWLGFEPDDARKVAKSLVENADLAEALLQKIKH